MKYVPSSLAVLLGTVSVGVAVYITNSGTPLWALILVAIFAQELLPRESTKGES